MKLKPLSVTLLALVGFTNLSGCSSVREFQLEPWVKPYERENLADPIMAFDRNGVDTKFMGHAFGNREAAVGAEGTGGGGCGCN